MIKCRSVGIFGSSHNKIYLSKVGKESRHVCTMLYIWTQLITSMERYPVYVVYKVMILKRWGIMNTNEPRLEKTYFLHVFENQKTNGPVNTHVISGPIISTKRTKPG